ncbi:MAG: NAD kinase [uncultured Thermomicrobiales bacterium]|uniref:NAD kinase n=1 Tax=uncultured Thermomicrobiales bacterium TaxID=1645740 RepID=A0A6J4V248_9BACT|nr:MAG: NAD kinase [uncultured Thermomicrobiales bacterium]
MTSTRAVGFVVAESKHHAAGLAADIQAFLREHDYEILDEETLNLGQYGALDAIIVLGGDGLMLRCAKRYPNVPILGINFGRVGFLASVEQRDWRSAMESFITGDFQVQDGATLAASLLRGDEVSDEGWAINDVVIRSGNRMVEIEVYVDGHYVNTYPGDGIVISTARGSTAYCMAAGGPILTGGVRGFAIVPISCHSPMRTPIVVAEETVIELLLRNQHDAQIIIDGRPTTLLGQGDVIHVQKGRDRFRLIVFETQSFFEAMRTKFNYQIRPGATPSRRPRLQEPDTVSG